jgi:hypothetical protein
MDGRNSRCDPPFPFARALRIWLTLVVVESIHGVTRRLVLEPLVGDRHRMA